jgi:hypothetical protein
MTDDLYIAADERARDARRAGLQAKKDEQPLNTTRSYASKQREWKARALSVLSLPSSPPSSLRTSPELTRAPIRAGAARRAPRRTARCTAGPMASS